MRFREMEEEFVWTTKDGRGLHLSEIDDQHLHNIERMMRRKIFAAETFALTLQGEMALVTIDAEIDNMEYDYDIICAEINRRKEVKNGTRRDTSDT